MNTDDFEKKLQRQPLRRIPGEWREEILRTAQANTPAAERAQPALVARAGLAVWRELIWPCRHAWSGLAALWLVLWAVNAQLTGTSRETIGWTTRLATDRIRSFGEQRQILVELTGPIERSPAQLPQRARPKPHSERALDVLIC